MITAMTAGVAARGSALCGLIMFPGIVARLVSGPRLGGRGDT